MSRINYCLEVVSQGRKADLERLQSVQSKAARWVLQTRLQDWSLTGGLKKLGWLSMAQQAAYVSIKTAMKILQDTKPERLYTILTEERQGVRARKLVNEKKFRKLKATTRKAWSWRSLRWLEQMPESLQSSNIAQKAVKRELKAWVKHHVPVRGDRILWGQPLTGDMKKKKAKEGEPGDGEEDVVVPRQPDRPQEGMNPTEPAQREQEVQGSLNEGGARQGLLPPDTLRRNQSMQKRRKVKRCRRKQKQKSRCASQHNTKKSLNEESFLKNQCKMIRKGGHRVKSGVG